MWLSRPQAIASLPGQDCSDRVPDNSASALGTKMGAPQLSVVGMQRSDSLPGVCRRPIPRRPRSECSSKGRTHRSVEGIEQSFADAVIHDAESRPETAFSRATKNIFKQASFQMRATMPGQGGVQGSCSPIRNIRSFRRWPAQRN